MKYTTRAGFAFVICSLCLLLTAGNCGSVPMCVNGIHPSTIDPGKSPCTTDCECNNQNFVGLCLNGTCSAVRRDTCETVGIFEKCTPKVARTVCNNGTRTCREAGLNATYWGNCRCEPEEETKTESTPTEPDSPDDAGSTTTEPQQEPAPDTPAEKGTADTMPEDGGSSFEPTPEQRPEPKPESTPEPAPETVPESAPEPTQESTPEPACPSGQSLCGAGCVNLSTDKSHCGKCNQVCQSQENCFSGVCAMPGLVLHYGHMSSAGCVGSSGCSPVSEGGLLKLYDASFSENTAVHNPANTASTSCIGSASSGGNLCLIGGFSAGGP